MNNQRRNCLSSRDSMMTRRNDLREESMMRKLDKRKSWIKLLKTMRIRSKRWPTTMRRLTMFLRRKRMQTKTTFKISITKLKRRISSCSNKLRAKINIWLKSKQIMPIYKTKLTNKMTCNHKSLTKKGKSCQRKLSSLHLRLLREKGL